MRTPSGPLSIKKSENLAVLELQSSVYPLPVVFSAAYSMLADAFILLDGDPGKKITVFIKSKTGVDPELLARQFGERLVTYGVSYFQEEKFGTRRDAILKRVLLTQLGGKP
jgi:hypothetical protein